MIKKYHVSQNMWDNLGFSASAINTAGTHITSNNYGTTLSTTTGGTVEITQTNVGDGTNKYQNGFFCIEIDFSQFSIGDNFVISFDYEVIEKHNTQSYTIAYVGQGTSSINVSGNWGANGRAVIKATFNSTMTKPYCEIRLCGNSIKVKNVQVNRGTDTLPYEPYSSEVWHTIGYKKYETATDTYTSLPQTIIGDGTAISAWSMKGNMSQSGTPTPSTPIYPQEVGEKTANLYTDIIYSANLNTNGIPSSMSGFNLYVAPVEEGKTYRHNGNVCAFFATKPTIGTPSFDGARSFSNQFTISTGVKWVAVRYADTATDAMIVQGTSMPSSYIPMGYKIPISFGQGTYTNYLAEPIRKINTAVDTMASTGTATHNITKYEFTGNESITKVNSTATNYLYYIVFTSTAIGGAMCSHLQYLSSGVSDNVGFSQNQTYPNTFYFNLGADIMNAQTSGNTTEGFKEWLTAQYAAGTPLTLWRILETPTTESFTVPSIPTSGTAQSFDVDTTLKPSEVSLTYHGWHEHEDTKFTT